MTGNLIDITNATDAELDALLDPMADLLAILDAPVNDTPAPTVSAPVLFATCPRCVNGRYVRGFRDLGKCLRCDGSGQVKKGTEHLRGRPGYSVDAKMAADEGKHL